LRKLEAQAEHRPGGTNWDWELDGSGLEGIPDSVGILTVKETAALLKISPNVVYELVRRQLPAIHIGSRIRIGRRGLVAYLRGMNADDFDALIKRRSREVQ
jgi:excisionase family DNA binding protein